jgi:hypothetical protein
MIILRFSYEWLNNRQDCPNLHNLWLLAIKSLIGHGDLLSDA